MSDTAPASVTFETTVTGTGNKTGIEVPGELIDALNSGKRPAVEVDVNGYRYRNTVGVMGGRYLISISAAIREQTGLAAGDPITVTLTVATAPRDVDIPADFAAALATHPDARAYFDALSNSTQRYHIDNINSAKADDTRQRRITNAVELFRAGKQR